MRLPARTLQVSIEFTATETEMVARVRWLWETARADMPVEMPSLKNGRAVLAKRLENDLDIVATQWILINRLKAKSFDVYI